MLGCIMMALESKAVYHSPEVMAGNADFEKLHNQVEESGVRIRKHRFCPIDDVYWAKLLSAFRQ